MGPAQILVIVMVAVAALALLGVTISSSIRNNKR